MKKTLLLLLLSYSTFSQNKVSETDKIESFIQVWGMLKYYHPEASKGAFDWNGEFIKEFQKIEPLETWKDLNAELIAWIKSYPSNKFKYSTALPEKENLFTKNNSQEWAANPNFDPELKELIQKNLHNTNYKDYYGSITIIGTVDFKNEKGLANFDVHNKSHRLLLLASFWNMTKYWNVNIYLADTPWAAVLPEMIPAFLEDDAKRYNLAKCKLFTKLNDSHADYYYYSFMLNSYSKFPNFGGRIINDSLVVNTVYNEQTMVKDDIALGDVIFAVDGTDLKSYYTRKFSELISVSNPNYLKRAIEKTYLLASSQDSILVGLRKKNGAVKNQYIHLSGLSTYSERFIRLRPKTKENYKKITDDIGYINLYHIDQKELATAFELFANTKGIIIDLRNYPEKIDDQSLPKFLYPHKTQFVKTLEPLEPALGIYGAKAALNIIKNPFAAGSENKNYYKGKVILLVDRSTASKAEWVGMAIQAAPNCITIGEQTFGAVMNRNSFTLADQTTIDFTAVGAFYPDNQNAQRKGLKIDRVVQESATNYQEDLYVTEAVKIIME